MSAPDLIRLRDIPDELMRLRETISGYRIQLAEYRDEIDHLRAERSALIERVNELLDERIESKVVVDTLRRLVRSIVEEYTDYPNQSDQRRHDDIPRRREGHCRVEFGRPSFKLSL